MIIPQIPKFRLLQKLRWLISQFFCYKCIDFYFQAPNLKALHTQKDFLQVFVAQGIVFIAFK